MLRSSPVKAITLVRAIASSLVPVGRQTLDVAVPPQPERALALLRRRDFRRTYVAVMISELGDAFQYIALMWIALETAGPLGVVAVRLADSLPALVFGLHGGVVADRFDRKRTMIAADVVRAAILVPIAIAGLAGELPLAGLVVAACGLTAATSYFVPAYGAIVPALVGRENVQQANGLVRATGDGLAVVGWALAALLLAFVPLSAFFALNAASFALSALLLAGIHVRRRADPAERPRIREGFTVLRRLPLLAGAIGVLGVAVTISSATWIVGVPELVRIGLARVPVRRKAEGSLYAWCAYLPGYLLFATAHSVGVALAASIFVGLGQGAAWVLANSAAQEQVEDRYLGRVMGLISLVHRGAHATGLLLIAPLFAFVDSRTVFAAAAVAIPLSALAGLVIASRRAAAAPAVA
jgi:MFS transporter, DHA3 family, macrolide efflux protein